jgi:hypothetical protein
MTDRTKRLRRPTRGVLTVHLLMIALIVLPHPVVPATITVDGQTGDDPGTCDLVEAIQNAEDDAQTHVDCLAGSGDDEIVLTENVVLTASEDGLPNDGTGLPRIDGADGNAITIQGNGFTIRRDLSSSDKFRLFSVSEYGDLTLNDVKLTGGLISATDQDSLGGAIFNRRGTVTLNNSTVSGNAASADPSYPNAYGGGIYNIGVLTVTDSTISDNRAESLGPVLAGVPNVGGGGISNCIVDCSGSANPQLTLTSSTISGNTAESAPGNDYIQPTAYGGGIFGPAGDLTVTNSTISDNRAIATGLFGPGAVGGGLEIQDGFLTLTSSTVSNNLVSAVGDNPLEGAAGLDYFGFTSGGVYVEDSVFGNHPGQANCYGIEVIHDGGNNLADDSSCGPIPSTLTGLSSVLTNNGGPTETHALVGASTAIDNAGTCGLLVDQRGEVRPADACDSGAYEVQPCAAPDGDSFEIADGTMISTEVTIETCTVITTAGTLDVFGGGHLILRTAGWVELGNGVVIDGMGNALTIEIDSGITMPDEQ